MPPGTPTYFYCNAVMTHHTHPLCPADRTAHRHSRQLRAARTRRLLVDASKFRPRTFMQVATLDEIDELICDDGLAVEEADRLRAMGKRLTLVSTS